VPYYTEDMAGDDDGVAPMTHAQIRRATKRLGKYLNKPKARERMRPPSIVPDQVGDQYYWP
jgi:hypothetical protein